jgi:hypothetical protein
MSLFVDELPDDKILPSVVPFSRKLVVLQGDEEDVGIVVTSKDVLVWVD